ncbi:hypothetical protein ANANG_G00000550, partial [Anguilla anguilla]
MQSGTFDWDLCFFSFLQNQMEAKTVETSLFPCDNNRHTQQMIVHQNQEIKVCIVYFKQ